MHTKTKLWQKNQNNYFAIYIQGILAQKHKYISLVFVLTELRWNKIDIIFCAVTVFVFVFVLQWALISCTDWRYQYSNLTEEIFVLSLCLILYFQQPNKQRLEKPGRVSECTNWSQNKSDVLTTCCLSLKCISTLITDFITAPSGYHEI